MVKLLNIKTFLVFTLILVALLSAAQLVMANGMSAEGKEIRNLEERKFQLQNEVRDLEKQVAALGSLTGVELQARELGLFYSPQAFEYFSPPKLAQVP